MMGTGLGFAPPFTNLVPIFTNNNKEPQVNTQQIAAKRGWQTLADGLIVVVIIAGVMPVVDAIRAADGWQAWIDSWAVWSWSAFQGALIAGGTAGVAWLRRRFIDPAESVSPRREALS